MFQSSIVVYELAFLFYQYLQPIAKETSLPVIAHNRWWCNETDYGARNGGQYDFIYSDSTGTSLPMDELFWNDLFKNSTAWGLKVYLQDWISKQVKYTPQMKQDLTLERNWLLQMGRGELFLFFRVLYSKFWNSQFYSSELEITQAYTLLCSFSSS